MGWGEEGGEREAHGRQRVRQGNTTKQSKDLPEVTNESGCSAGNLMPLFRPLKYYRPWGHPTLLLVCSQTAKQSGLSPSIHGTMAKDKTPTHGQKSNQIQPKWNQKLDQGVVTMCQLGTSCQKKYPQGVFQNILNQCWIVSATRIL